MRSLTFQTGEALRRAGATLGRDAEGRLAVVFRSRVYFDLDGDGEPVEFMPALRRCGAADLATWEHYLVLERLRTLLGEE